jgi:4-aminobutyrate aminotransferase
VPDSLSEVWFSVTGLPVVRGSGSWVYAKDGRRYLDLSSGIAVTSTGHCHPRVVAAIQRQAGRFIHAQVNVYRHDLLEPLGDRLREITPDGIERFFFTNSGSEAVESAVKLAKHATGRPNVIVFSGGFHGRTHLTMAMSTSAVSLRAGYGPLPAGVHVAPFAARPDQAEAALGALAQLLATQSAPADTAAMVLELVQGEGGYLPADRDFVHGVRRLCAEHGILFIADEVQTGFARTGEMFAVDAYQVRPDIMVLGKGIASGFPLSAIGSSAAIMSAWAPGAHGSTYGGNPLGCAAALETIAILTEPGFSGHVRARSRQLFDGARALAARCDFITDVRGLGLMLGIEFDTPARTSAFAAHCLREDSVIVMGAASGRVIRCMPPLTVSAEEIDLALASFQRAAAATEPAHA